MIHRKSLLYLLLFSFFIIIDQAVKNHFLAFSFLTFHFSYNPGIAFGFFPNISSWIIALALIAILVFWKRSRPIRPALFLIFAGGASNLLDRLRFGAVVDYLYFGIGPRFNLADVSLNLGVILLIYAQARDYFSRQSASGRQQAKRNRG